MSYAEYEWMKQQLSRFTYKPGYVMSLVWRDDPYGAQVVFRMEFRAPDSRSPDANWCRSPIPLVFSFTKNVAGMFAARDPDAFARWLARVLMENERHEMQEWLRRDGEIFDDPHNVRIDV